MRIFTTNKTYQVNDKNEITQLGFSYSGKWLLLGAVRYNNFGYIVENFTIDQLKNDKLDFYHKNGKPRIFIVDLDHGTTRIWGNGATVHNCGLLQTVTS